MTNLIYDLIFLLFTLYVLLKVIGYGIYEIKTLHNKSGGIAIIAFSSLVIVFINIMVFLQ